MTIKTGSGMSDDWGFGIFINIQDRSFCVSFIKFYLYVEVWKR